MSKKQWLICKSLIYRANTLPFYLTKAIKYGMIDTMKQKGEIFMVNYNFSSQEELIPKLRTLYEKLGYKKYKMSKFEEYDFYLENKSFLKSKNIITFNDLNGKLLALKPDVTLSIVKNSGTSPQKLYYTENVYRVKSGQYKEIMQVGLEYIGNVDTYTMGEVISLAAKSLGAISDSFALDISHMGFISGLLDELNLSGTEYEKLIELISRKDAHEIKALCENSGAAQEITEKIISMATLYGSFDEILPICRELSVNEKTENAVDELSCLGELLKATGWDKNINLDFSIVNDMSYYNGVIFQGFINGITGSVLSGGRYDNLLSKMGKPIGAIGFAIYTDMFEYLEFSNNENDVDVILIYTADTDVVAVAKKVRELTEGGLTVLASTEIPKNLKYKLTVNMNEKGGGQL